MRNVDSVKITEVEPDQLTKNTEVGLSIGDSRHSMKWKNQTILWSDFLGRLTIPTITQETVAEYQKMAKSRRDQIKDVGGFVGGFLKQGRRKSGHVQTRSMITLDADSGYKELWEDMQMLSDYCMAVYTTHSHTSAKPRYRFIIPLSRPVTGDEYEPIARKLASQFGMDYFDDTTYQPERLMYWPSHSRDGEYLFDFVDEPWIDPDVILESYPDWRDSSYWPESSRAAGIRKKSAEKQGNPLEKPGIIGAFCRTYDIASAIEAFLSETYLPTGRTDRYTYAEGSTSGGLVVYEDKFAYSHHGTDIIGDQLVNAFDLVRLHKFGDLDEDAKPQTNTSKLPSFKAMQDFAMELPDVKTLLVKERMSQADADFGEWTEDELNNDDWVSLLEVNKKGEPTPTASNLEIIFKHDPRLKNRIVYDSFSNRNTLVGDLPWRKIGEEKYWKDSDDAGLRVYIEKTYGIVNKGKIEDAFSQEVNRNVIHPVRNYIDNLIWDGVERLETVLVDYQGAEDTTYNRLVTRKFLVAAVARVYVPGVKFDNMLVTTGPQGIGKTLLANKLAGEWFSNSLEEVRGKDAYESLQGAWIMEMGELTATKKADIETIKHFLSKQEDIYRQAYGRRKSYFKRQCVFWGTSNDTEFLRDRTGNRRFWPVQVGVHEAPKKVWEMSSEERDQIWAEAKVLWDIGEKLYLSNEEEKLARIAQSNHFETSVMEGEIKEFLEIPIPVDWYDRSKEERRSYIRWYGTANAEEVDVDLTARTKISVAEVWNELYGGDTGKIHPAKHAEIRSIISTLSGWERHSGSSDGRLRLGPGYGRQVTYIKDDNLPF